MEKVNIGVLVLVILPYCLSLDILVLERYNSSCNILSIAWTKSDGEQGYDGYLSSVRVLEPVYVFMVWSSWPSSHHCKSVQIPDLSTLYCNNCNEAVYCFTSNIVTYYCCNLQVAIILQYVVQYCWKRENHCNHIKSQLILPRNTRI